MKDYSVRIYTDGTLYEYRFYAPSRRTDMYLQGMSNRDLVTVGGGILFSHDWCPDSPWCVFYLDKRGVLVPIPAEDEWAPSNYTTNLPDLLGEPDEHEDDDVQFAYPGRPHPS